VLPVAVLTVEQAGGSPGAVAVRPEFGVVIQGLDRGVVGEPGGRLTGVTLPRIPETLQFGSLRVRSLQDQMGQLRFGVELLRVPRVRGDHIDHILLELFFAQPAALQLGLGRGNRLVPLHDPVEKLLGCLDHSVVLADLRPDDLASVFAGDEEGILAGLEDWVVVLGPGGNVVRVLGNGVAHAHIYYASPFSN
jgi:hypothetical protein